MDLKHKGYTNYETWFVKFHLFDEEEMFWDWDFETLKEHAYDSLGSDEMLTDNIVSQFLAKVDWLEIEETIQWHKEEYTCANCEEPTEERFCCKRCEEEFECTATYEKG